VGTNFFFRGTDYNPEQNLLQDLATEMIQIFGVDVYYVIRTTNYIDPLFTEAPTSRFNIAVPIEMYINSYDGFAGDGDLISKFGLNVADKLTLSISRTRFAEDIGSVYSLIRPQEGDLVYFPLTKGIFEVKFVEHEAAFYQTGALQYFELQLEKFNYDSEIFATGIPAIDSIQTTYSVADYNYTYLTENNYSLYTEANYNIVNELFGLDESSPISENEEFVTLENTFVDFSETNPFGDVV
jgi:hypothetical protein